MLDPLQMLMRSAGVRPRSYNLRRPAQTREAGRMLPIVSIHVPIANPIGPKNLKIGIEEGVWGWGETVWSSAKARRSIESLVVGQPVLLALGGPNPRRTTWTSDMTPFRRVAAGTITRSVYESGVPIWPDGIYPHRIGIRIHVEANDVPLDVVDSDNWEAIRLSGCVHGAPYITETDWELDAFADLIGRLADGEVLRVRQTRRRSRLLSRSSKQVHCLPITRQTERSQPPPVLNRASSASS